MPRVSRGLQKWPWHMLELVGQTELCVSRNGVVFILVRLSRGGSVGYDGQQSGSHKDWSVRGWTGRKGKCYVCTIMCIVVMRRLFCRLQS